VCNRLIKYIIVFLDITGFFSCYFYCKQSVKTEITPRTAIDIFEDNEEFRKKTTAHFELVTQDLLHSEILSSLG